jgi:glycerol-3-phosphate dehydrogenase (NAD(P)+)
MSSDRIAIIGTGSWGTTLAVLAARVGRNVTLWARTSEEAAELNARRENIEFLPGIPLPLILHVTSDLEQAARDAALVLVVVPSQLFRANVRLLQPFLSPDAIVVSAAKGIELKSLLRMSEILRAELPDHPPERTAILSGPNIAREIAAGLPATTVIAAPVEDTARVVQEQLMAPAFRIYTHTDVAGVELAGALKNVYAIAAGVADGYSVGENAKAALLTRALAEMTRLGTALGANPLTFAGLAGVGDLICTCNSHHSRNHTVGEQLAQGQRLADIQSGMKMVAEGISTTKAAHELAARNGIEMPLVDQVYAVLFEEKTPRQAIGDLLGRGAKAEFWGLS